MLSLKANKPPKTKAGDAKEIRMCTIYAGILNHEDLLCSVSCCDVAVADAWNINQIESFQECFWLNYSEVALEISRLKLRKFRGLSAKGTLILLCAGLACILQFFAAKTTTATFKLLSNCSLHCSFKTGRLPWTASPHVTSAKPQLSVYLSGFTNGCANSTRRLNKVSLIKHAYL